MSRTMIGINKAVPFWYLLIMMALTLLSACSLATDTDLSTEKLMLSEGGREFYAATATLSADQVQAVSRDFKANGSGPLTVDVTYDHLQKPQAKAIELAQLQANYLGEYLRTQGVQELQINVIPSLTKPPGMVSFAYNTLGAFAPQECESRMPGVGMAMNQNPNYRFGCENKRMLAEMVAYPEDLMGAEETDDMGSQRLSVPMERYNTGQPITDTEVDIGTGVAE